MIKYKIGDKMVFKTDNDEAYHSNLLSEEELRPGELEVLSEVHWGDSDYWDKVVHFHRLMRFYGKVIGIEEGNHIEGTPSYRLINCLFSNGKEIGFLEDKAKGFRKANLLEILTRKFGPSIKVT